MMTDLHIPGGKYTPEIIGNGQERSFSIRGKSYPENTFEFYRPIFDWLRALVGGETRKPLRVDFFLQYYNSSSSKVLYDLFDLLEDAHDRGYPVAIHWHYHPENETIEEAGQDFAEDFPSLSLSLVAKEEDERG